MGMYIGRKLLIREHIAAVKRGKKKLFSRFRNGEQVTVLKVKQMEQGLWVLKVSGRRKIGIGERGSFPSREKMDQVLLPGWCMTVNLSQGKEWDVVTLVIPPSDASTWSREYLYVGFRCVVVGNAWRMP